MHKHALLVLLAGLLVAADAKDDSVQKELKKFAGTWVLVEGEKDGQPLTADIVKKSKITWKGKDCVIESPHQSKEPMRASAKLDPGQKPKTMDWVRSVGPDAGKPMHAIYEFTGDDQYRVVFAPAGKERPTDFSTKPGTGHIMHVWKRVAN